MLEIEYEFGDKDLVHYNELQIDKSEDLQKKLKRNRLVFPGVLALFGLFLWVYYSDYRTALYIVTISICWAVVIPQIIILSFRKQVLNSYTKEEKDAMFGHYTLRIDPKALAEISPSGKNKMPWKTILRIEHIRDYIHIVLDNGAALVIPIEKVTSGEVKDFSRQVKKMIDLYG
ncbi:YcxB family protein [Methyloprofundus sp.]|uniref:YcxB family protein n=1 Tax=Methyloprofundus sp. TaxID=2020875 RepID=UPI003D0A1EB1